VHLAATTDLAGEVLLHPADECVRPSDHIRNGHRKRLLLRGLRESFVLRLCYDLLACEQQPSTNAVTHRGAAAAAC
jgi:hypothetical protein